MKSEVPAAADFAGPAATPKKIVFSVEARDKGGAIVLHCQGRLIFRSEADALARTVNEILPLARRMVIDLAGIEAVDSAGLGQLVLLHMWADSGGYTLKFSGARKSVSKVLELTNLDQVLDLYSSVPEAIAAMQQEDACSA
jgi:anti-sigma B factor antagonist